MKCRAIRSLVEASLSPIFYLAVSTAAVFYTRNNLSSRFQLHQFGFRNSVDLKPQLAPSIHSNHREAELTWDVITRLSISRNLVNNLPRASGRTRRGRWSRGVRASSVCVLRVRDRQHTGGSAARRVLSRISPLLSGKRMSHLRGCFEAHLRQCRQIRRPMRRLQSSQED